MSFLFQKPIWCNMFYFLCVGYSVYTRKDAISITCRNRWVELVDKRKLISLTKLAVMSAGLRKDLQRQETYPIVRRLSLIALLVKCKPVKHPYAAHHSAIEYRASLC